ncbi:MAG TPA: outer membrane beta-barrel protein [Polyangia bacterium]
MRSRKNLVVGLGIALLTLLGSFSVAQAQYAPPPPYYPPPPPPPPRGVYRSGLVYGFALGIGSFAFADCGDVCGPAGMFEGHIGGMIGPRLALEGDFWGGVHTFSDTQFNLGTGTTYNGIYTLALQYWLTDIIWIKGGLGGGNVQISSDNNCDLNLNCNVDDETGFAFMLGAGIEIVQSYYFALDLQLRYGNVVYSAANNGGFGDGDTNMFALMVGFNWY